MKKISLYFIFLVFITNVSGQQNASINAAIKTAKLLERRGDIDGAISIYKGILEKNSKHTMSVHRIKSLFLNYEKYNDGIEFLYERISKEPYEMRLYSELGELHYLNEEKEKAQEIWSSAFVKFNNNQSFFRIMVSMYGKYGLENDLEKVLKIGKNQFGRSFLSYESGVYFQARRVYDKAMDQFILYLIHEPKQNGIIERRILLMSDEKEALQIIEGKLIEASEKNPRKILNVLSEYYFKQQDYDQAFKKKKAWSLVVENNIDEWIGFANELRKESQFSYAIKSYNIILSRNLHPNIAGKALLGLAQTFEDQIIPSDEPNLIPFFYNNNIFFEDPFKVYSSISKENLSSSIALYDSMLVTLQRSPLLAEAFFKLGEIQYRILQDFDQAYVLFSKALKNKPDKNLKLKIILRIADVLLARGQSEETKIFLTRQLNRNPLPEIELKKILVHFLNDKPDSTLQMVNSLLFNMIPVDPSFNDLMELKNIINKYYQTDGEGQEAFLHFLKAENYLRQKKLGDAIQELLFVINELPNAKIIPLVNLRLSLLHYRLKDYERALEFALTLQDTDLADKGIILSGQIYEFKLSNLEKALEQYMRILDEYPSSIFSEPIRYHIRGIEKVES
ncbi:MAG: tetratricopeptide repeat protein [Candidatus Marinimicrobia bacterium]|nr:tetratricopeptide repeat protein [Candidatus Neomarinimicrobiota bacterium]|tara:strand:- start:6759 stop:8621 length:1863 start_codon:yes stop_codon:yes gene_type:complete